MRHAFKPLLCATAIVALAVPQFATAAPRVWMLPSETQFTGSGDEWATVDAAMSTDLYYPDHPGQAWQPIVSAPDGSTVAVDGLNRGKLRVTFDLHVTQKGTYKLAIVNDSVMGSYVLDGERKMLPRGTTPATLATLIPAGATEVQTAESNSRIETFVTAGEPSTTVFTPTGKGLEMVPVTHPNDVGVNEPATFQFLLDGKPAAGITVAAINGGVRYSAKGLTEIDLTTDAQGKVTIKWPAAGMWWVGASIGGQRGEGGGPGGPGGQRPEGAPRGGGEGGPGRQPGAAGPGAGGPGGEGMRPMGPPQRRAAYAMTVEVL